MGSTLRSRLAIWMGLATLLGALMVGLAGTYSTTAGIAVIVLAPFVGWLLGRVVARRQTSAIERLGATATSFASGDRDARAATDGPREVRIVAEAFNRMADEVSRALARLVEEEHRKTQFVSDVSHELRTPLTAIKGAAETLLDGDVEPVDQQRFLATIATEAERLARLANDLLTLQRIEGATGELPLRRNDLRLAAERAAALLEPLMEDRGVELQVTGSAPEVLGDVDRLQQVVANLIDNASRFVGEGGHVTVALAGDEEWAILTVSDDGPGISPVDLPNLFDRFYRADSSRTRSSGGAGLGLSIVRAIVTAHAGTIEAANLEGGGLRITVKLPRLPE